MSRSSIYGRATFDNRVRFMWLSFLGLLAMGCLPAGALADQAKVEREREATVLVTHALDAESDGKSADRDALLKWALQKLPDFAPALWHSGFVRVGKQWVKADDVPAAAANNKDLAAYRELRQKYPQTADGQLRLARWCGQHKLPGEERAHLTKVLELDPNNAEARKRLHFVFLAGKWHSEEDLRVAAAQADRMAASLKKWSNRVKPIAKALDQSNGKATAAANRLQAIQDPDAIPALECALGELNEPAARLLVDALGKMQGPDSTLALARQAVGSPWRDVREQAAEKLKPRHEDEYMPALMSALSTPIQSKTELFQSPDGRLIYNRSFYREGQDVRDLAVFQTSFQRVGQTLGASELLAVKPGPVQRFADGSTRQQNTNYYNVNTPSEPDLQRLKEAMIKTEQANAADQALKQAANAQIDLQNTRVCEALAAVTGKDDPMSPEDWWRWWNDHNEVVLVGDKPLRQAVSQEQLRIADVNVSYNTAQTSVNATGPTPSYPQSSPISVPRPQRISQLPPLSLSGAHETGVVMPSFTGPMDGDHCSCLPAGTPIWTESGAVYIERIQIGDLVLSQNPETGELAYKPVLKTTIRAAAPLMTFCAGKEEIRATAGHAFWVDRAGWVRVRQLETGAQLHAMAGAATVEGVARTETIAPVFNLVVADFHSYFVGKSRVLSHDITARQTVRGTPVGLQKQPNEADMQVSK